MRYVVRYQKWKEKKYKVILNFIHSSLGGKSYVRYLYILGVPYHHILNNLLLTIQSTEQIKQHGLLSVICDQEEIIIILARVQYN